MALQSKYQINGSAVHSNVDGAIYSTDSNVLQGISVFSERYGVIGKIDLFNIKTGVLTERKRTVKTIYDGYIFQVYAQYFSLQEMGYTVNKINIHSYTDNKNYSIKLPEEDNKMLSEFENIIAAMRSFNFDEFEQTNIEKCNHCIYEPACYKGKEE